MIDVYFVEFYIGRKYNQGLEEYFKVSPQVTTAWRRKKFPEARIHEFCYREGSTDIYELFRRIYTP
jgi:hypothetical protein